MSSNEELKNVLLDVDLITKLVVGIGEVAEITTVPTRQIRYWEEKGIISSTKEAEGTTRKYDYLNVKKFYSSRSYWMMAIHSMRRPRRSKTE